MGRMTELYELRMQRLEEFLRAWDAGERIVVRQREELTHDQFMRCVEVVPEAIRTMYGWIGSLKYANIDEAIRKIKDDLTDPEAACYSQLAIHVGGFIYGIISIPTKGCKNGLHRTIIRRYDGHTPSINSLE